MDESEKRLISKTAHIPAVLLAPEYVFTGRIRSECLIFLWLGLWGKNKEKLLHTANRVSQFEGNRRYIP